MKNNQHITGEAHPVRDTTLGRKYAAAAPTHPVRDDMLVTYGHYDDGRTHSVRNATLGRKATRPCAAHPVRDASLGRKYNDFLVLIF